MKAKNNTPKYFAKRQEQNMKRQHDRASQKMKIINRDFDKSLNLLENDIERILGNVRGMTPQEVRAKLNETISNKEYDKLLELFQTTKNKDVRRQIKQKLKIEANKFRISRKEAIIDSINRERLRMTDSVLTNTTDQLKKSIQETSSMFGGHFDNEMVDSILNSKWAGNNYSQRIWNNQRALASTLQSELMQAFIAGKTNKDISRVLEQYTDYGRHVANRLIRTETSYMVNKTDLEDSKNRGIKAKKFEANLDSRTSKICRENNQKIIPIDKIKVGENSPPLHPYCRSFLSDVLKGWDYDSDDELGKLIKNSEIENRKSQERYSNEVTKGIIKSKGTPNPDVEQYNRYKNTINADNFNLSFDEFVKIKYNNYERYDALKLEYRDEKLRHKIKTEFNLNIHEGRQGKHIKGHNNYSGKSYVFDEINLEELINFYAGRNEIRRDKNGKWIKKEFVEHNDYIGVVMNLDGTSELTNYFSISYSKEGVHIVPRRRIK